jgi:hypothetical protein
VVVLEIQEVHQVAVVHLQILELQAPFNQVVAEETVELVNYLPQQVVLQEEATM